MSSDVVVGPGEQLLVSGTRYSPNPEFFVAAFRTDGSTDTAFGAGGLVTTSIGDGADRDRVGGMVLTDNKIVVAGSSAPSEGESGFVAARYLLPGGQPDPLFSVDGRTFTDFGWVATGQGAAPGAAVKAVVAESDGRVVLGGTSPQGWTLVRYLPNGTPDASFGADGIVGLKRLDDGQLRNLVVQGTRYLPPEPPLNKTAVGSPLSGLLHSPSARRFELPARSIWSRGDNAEQWSSRLLFTFRPSFASTPVKVATKALRDRF